ncbi:MAG: hypothetical protein QG588_1958 [Candidatus Poribacteria bacterium]|nr:hypothetical protein [Candidatus Poribacteria bacterium]
MLQHSTIKSIDIASSIDEIISMYEISENDDVEKIRDFIENHEHLIPILNEAKENIISVFGNCVRIFLELYYDIEEGWEQIFIVIKSPYDSKKAVELKIKLLRGWFVKKTIDTKDNLGISEESL